MLLVSFLVACVVVYFSKHNFKFDPITMVNVLLLTCLLFIILSSNLSVSLTYENFVEHNKNKSTKKSIPKESNKKSDKKSDIESDIESDKESNKRFVDKKPEQASQKDNDNKNTKNVLDHQTDTGLNEKKLEKEFRERDNNYKDHLQKSEKDTLISNSDNKKPSQDYQHTDVDKTTDNAKHSQKHSQKHKNRKNSRKRNKASLIHHNDRHGDHRHGDHRHGDHRHGDNKRGDHNHRHGDHRHGDHNDRHGDHRQGRNSRARARNTSNKQQKAQPIKIVNNVTYKNDDNESISNRATSSSRSGDYSANTGNKQRLPHYMRRSNLYDDTPDYYYPGDNEEGGESDDYDNKYFKEGWSYMPPSQWSIPHKRDPVCVSSKKCPVCPVESIIKPYSEFLGSKEWNKK